jgi:hypothetical protein
MIRIIDIVKPVALHDEGTHILHSTEIGHTRNRSIGSRHQSVIEGMKVSDPAQLTQ